MDYAKPLDTISVLVPVDKHPKVSKGGNHALDLACKPGDPVYAIADGKIPHVSEDSLDGGVVGGSLVPVDLTRAQKGVGPAIRMVYGHVSREDHKRTVVKKGDQIGTATGYFVHLGFNRIEPAKEIEAM